MGLTPGEKEIRVDPLRQPAPAEPREPATAPSPKQPEKPEPVPAGR